MKKRRRRRREWREGDQSERMKQEAKGQSG